MEKIGNSQGTTVACRYLRIVGLPGVGLAGFYCNFLFLIMREKIFCQEIQETVLPVKDKILYRFKLFP